MKLIEDRNFRMLLLLALGVFLIVNTLIFFQDREPEFPEFINPYDQKVFAAAEVDAAILDYLETYRTGLPDSLEDLDLSEALKEILEVDNVGLAYEKLSPTEYELTISGLEDMPIVYRRMSSSEYELIIEGLDEEPIIFSGGEADD